MRWQLIRWIITKILWRSNPERGSDAKVEAGHKLFHWFTPYPEYKGFDVTITKKNIYKGRDWSSTDDMWDEKVL